MPLSVPVNAPDNWLACGAAHRPLELRHSLDIRHSSFHIPPFPLIDSASATDMIEDVHHSNWGRSDSTGLP